MKFVLTFRKKYDILKKVACLEHIIFCWMRNDQIQNITPRQNLGVKYYPLAVLCKRSTIFRSNPDKR